MASLAAWAPVHAGERCVEDDADQEVCLEAPAQRIVALSPGATELLFAAGAGDHVVAAVSHADYPEEAADLPRVGSYDRLDMESILAHEPDLVIGWTSGNSSSQLERIESLGVPLYRSDPRQLEEIATSLERLGALAGSEETAEAEAARFRDAVAELEAEYAGRDPVRVFYQIWPDPVMTINDEQIISESIRICGGENVFGDLGSLTPRLDTESVLEADPEAIVAGGMGEADDAWLDEWRRYDVLEATAKDNLFFVQPSTIQRPTPRILEGTRALCDKLEQARRNR
ncbi:cobalamin-binding protein [Halorhodospira halophila]|uniref:cobalamin-binding protein n=1 Tax=Halorhodospira halophila TaxID=1053 RepID=UPI001F5C62FB|nr:cobalamin-binding protein [Halorhodospira halophila]MBK5936518.1 cobalamin-binding protein [Halorhodospira halophila]